MVSLEQIKQKLERYFLNAAIVVRDFSEEHSGHGAHGSHIEVDITTNKFEGKSNIEQHQMVYAALKSELEANEIHALLIKTKVK